jgi:crotonobetainyl-CoA:carnitine CoA-transferase CaiB-like acyl-CoA transferase
MDRALSGLKVVEYAHFIAGPYCAKMMAGLGAEVIKVEEPEGDPARQRGPFLDDLPHPERSGLFLYLNANKLGVTLNLRCATGLEMFQRLVAQADVLIEDSPPALARELGIHYQAFREVNPALVMTSITDFGQSGPYRDYKSCNLVANHMGGIGYLTPGIMPSLEEGSPLKGGGHQADFMAALSAAIVTMAAVYERRRTGEGCHLDLSEYEAVAAIAGRDIAAYSYEGTLPQRHKAMATGSFGLVPCRDGYFQVHCRRNEEWRSFLEVLGCPELVSDERFLTPELRTENWSVLKPLLAQHAMHQSKEELYRRLQARRLACAPANTIADAFDSPHLATRGFPVNIEHPAAGRVRYPGGPYLLSQTPWQVERPAPLLGQHNEEVFCERLGFSKEELARLRESSAI